MTDQMNRLKFGLAVLVGNIFDGKNLLDPLQSSERREILSHKTVKSEEDVGFWHDWGFRAWLDPGAPKIMLGIIPSLSPTFASPQWFLCQ